MYCGADGLRSGHHTTSSGQDLGQLENENELGTCLNMS